MLFVESEIWAQITLPASPQSIPPNPPTIISLCNLLCSVSSLCFCEGGFEGGFEFSPGDARKTVCLSLTLTPSSTFMPVSVVTFLWGCLRWVVVVVVGVCMYLLFQGPDIQELLG